jgi:sterol 3beta-glucosyltransferase
MRALLLTVGSQGDVQPFVALAARLRDAGHEAVLAAPAVYGGLAAVRDVPFAPLGLDMEQVGAAVHAKHGLRHMLAFTRAMGRRAGAVLPALTSLAHDGADVIVHHPLVPLGQHLAEFLDVPAVVASPIPVLVPTTDFLSPAWPCATRLPGVLNRATYPVTRYLSGAWCRREIDAWRWDELALAPRPGHHDPLVSHSGWPVTVLHSFSAHVVRRPADWPETAHITGYWSAAPPGQPPGQPPGHEGEGAWAPPRRLAEFLDAGEPPVYLGFGSMPAEDPVVLADAIVTATTRTGVRFIVYSLSPELRRGLSAAAAPAGQVLAIRQIPHDWLFPRIAAVVHHGGAGTTGAAVVAGRPQVIWPFGIDQHFWAGRMADLGVAVPARPVRELTGQTLAHAVDRATNDDVLAARAIELAHRVAAEDGTGTAVAHLERVTGITDGARTAVPA